MEKLEAQGCTGYVTKYEKPEKEFLKELLTKMDKNIDKFIFNMLNYFNIKSFQTMTEMQHKILYVLLRHMQKSSDGRYGDLVVDEIGKVLITMYI